jgi:hypothetical protein
VQAGAEGGEGAGLGANPQQAVRSRMEPRAGLVVEADRAVVEPGALRPGQDCRGEAGRRHRATEDHAGPQIVVERQRDRVAGGRRRLGQGGSDGMEPGRGRRIAGRCGVQAADQLQGDGGPRRRHRQAGRGGHRIDAARHGDDAQHAGTILGQARRGRSGSGQPRATGDPRTDDEPRPAHAA